MQSPLNRLRLFVRYLKIISFLFKKAAEAGTTPADAHMDTAVCCHWLFLGSCRPKMPGVSARSIIVDPSSRAALVARPLPLIFLVSYLLARLCRRFSLTIAMGR
ncbi:hypothetical protein SLA2020_155880 [Shorea laevis]